MLALQPLHECCRNIRSGWNSCTPRGTCSGTHVPIRPGKSQCPWGFWTVQCTQACSLSCCAQYSKLCHLCLTLTCVFSTLLCGWHWFQFGRKTLLCKKCDWEEGKCRCSRPEGVNITICAVISSDGLQLHKARLGPCNTADLTVFLGGLYERLSTAKEKERSNLPVFEIIWDNVAFHHSCQVTEWFPAHPRIMSLFLPPYSPFLNRPQSRISSVMKFFPHGDGRYRTIAHIWYMTRCHF